MSDPSLARIRAAHVERVAEAFERVCHRRGGEPAGMPDRLVDAGCWLVANGWDGEASPAEQAFGWGPVRYRSFLIGAGPSVARACIREGYRALFEGRRPIYAATTFARAA